MYEGLAMGNMKFILFSPNGHDVNFPDVHMGEWILAKGFNESDPACVALKAELYRRIGVDRVMEHRFRFL